MIVVLAAGSAAAVLAYLVLDEVAAVRRTRRASASIGVAAPRQALRMPDLRSWWASVVSGDAPFRTIQVLAGATVVLFAVGLLARAFLPIAVASVLGVVSTWLWSQRRRWTLAVRIDQQLPDAMNVMASALAAGGTLFQALEAAAQESPSPLGHYLSQAVARCRVNQTVEASLAQLKGEVRSRDVGNVIAALAIQRTTGGDLARLLRDSADVLREEQRLRADARALSAQARYSAQLVGLMPVALFGLFYAFFPTFVAPLTDTPVGLLILTYSAVSVAIGFYFVWRIATRIEDL